MVKTKTRRDPPWVRVGALLSLDLAQAHVRTMGLPLDGAAVSAAIRDAFSTITDLAEDEANWPIDVGAAYQRAIEHRLGSEAGVTFRRWAEHVFVLSHEEHPQWSGWLTAIRLARKGKRYNHLVLPSAHRKALFSGFVEATDMSDVETTIGDGRDGPFSDWDVLTMAHHTLDPGYRPVDPFTWIVKVARMHRFQVFARRFDEHLDDEMRRTLRHSTEDFLKDRQVWLPVPLEDWRDLTAGPPC